MESLFAPALLPLKRYAQFGGRSTRTELAAFYLLVVFVNAGLEFVGGLVGYRADRWLPLLLALIIACPSLALVLRRLHDSGRSGWWVLLGLPAFSLGLWHGWLKLRDPYAINPLHDLPYAFGLVVGILAVLLFILLLLGDEDEANRYGPNPRDATEGEPA